MNHRSKCQFALAALLCLCLPLSVRAQAFTNSATLSAALDGTGTNLVVRYSLANTQGWVTLFQAGSLTDLATNAQPFDLAPASATGQGQFTVPINPAAPSQFYRLLLEQWPSRGKALVWTNGPLDFAAMRATYGDITNIYNAVFGTNQDGQYYITYQTNCVPMIFKQPVEVWLDNLGSFNSNGDQIAGNAGILQGKYVTAQAQLLDYTGVNLYSTNNDFRVNYNGDSNVSPKDAVLWSAEVQTYYVINTFRKNFLSDSFIRELNLPPSIQTNLIRLQYRPDMAAPPHTGYAFYPKGPSFDTLESVFPAVSLYSVFGSLAAYDENSNLEVDPARSRDPRLSVNYGANWTSLPPIAFAWNPSTVLHEYAGLMMGWVLGTNTFLSAAWPSGNFLYPFNDGISEWSGYRFTGDTDVGRYTFYALRIWNGSPCGGSFIPCDKGTSVRNVMMFDESNSSGNGVFPFTVLPTYSYLGAGDSGSDLAGFYFAAIFYDVANDAGLGLHKADLLYWKTISVVSNNVTFGMRDFGAAIQLASRVLWPDPRAGRAGLSLYEEDIADVLTSRGIPLNNVSDFRSNLPAGIGPTPKGYPFDSVHPDPQVPVDYYGSVRFFRDSYVISNSSPAYVTYQFYKHSKYGPCDKLALSDGTFNTNGTYNGDGTFYTELVDRDLGNIILFAPGSSIKWSDYRERCPNEATGYYAEDVRPFGFIVTKATLNGFSFTATNLSETASTKTYSLSIVDPSLATLGAASYAWSFTNYDGTFQTATGTNVQYTALKDQPFTLSIARTRSAQADTLTLRERGNDLDRNGGNAFVRNLVP